MFESVTAIAPARLHLGFLDLNGGLGRRFGSIGLAIDHPVTRLSIARASTPSVEGLEARRAATYFDALTRRLDLPGAYRVTIDEAIPDHVGLGSGTQLALALASALRHLEGLAPDVPGDALALQRSQRSGIGVGLFERGGVIVDGGRAEATITPPVIARLDFPAAWRVMLVLDSRLKGLHGAQETESFAALAPFESAAAAEICRLVLIKALPALAEADIEAFGGAIERIQEIVGAYFAPAQGGAAHTSAAVAQMLGALRRHGAKGAGQSSWGPTGFAFVADAAEARRLCDLLRGEAAALGVDIAVCKGLNHGALVKGHTSTAGK
ncbi:MAG: beta-ribofuranosylaminobenzene 5'-phosphate synthase family protein [Methylocella sp.]